MSEIKYGQKIVETIEGATTVKITTEGYWDGLKHVKEQIREDINTKPQTLLTDVIKCLEVLKTTNTPDLVIRISRDKHDSVSLIQKTWQIDKRKVG